MDAKFKNALFGINLLEWDGNRYGPEGVSTLRSIDPKIKDIQLGSNVATSE